MLDYKTFKEIFDNKIFAKSKPDLLKKVAEYPDRYVGSFRPTKPHAKLLQNLLQSNEIRFGDAFEMVIEAYLINEGWQPLSKNIVSTDGDALNVDQLLIKNGEVLFIEQKVRDDHDSTKKRGQISNFEKKLEALQRIYGDKLRYGFFYFIDPSLVKNKNYYEPELRNLQDTWGVELHVSYGKDLFARLDCPQVWDSILANLETWREGIPDLPEVDFDISPQKSAEEIKELPFSVWRKLFDNPRVVEQILPVIFSNGETLELVLRSFRAQDAAISQAIQQRIADYLDNR